MSGYLTRLVTRMTDEPSIRPRVASRFEAEAVGRSHEGAPELLETPSDAIEVPTIDRSAAVPAAPPPAGAVDPGLLPARHPELASLVRRLTAGNAPPTVDSVAVATVAPEPATSRSSAPARAATLAWRPSPALGEVDGSPPSPIQAAARTETTAIVRRVDQARQPIRAEARSVSTDDGFRAGRREPDVVQVHIGRVEVRAIGTVPAQPPAARRADGPRPLPLDRYLAGDRRS